jgi:hypothetical protein
MRLKMFARPFDDSIPASCDLEHRQALHEHLLELGKIKPVSCGSTACAERPIFCCAKMLRCANSMKHDGPEPRPNSGSAAG